MMYYHHNYGNSLYNICHRYSQDISFTFTHNFSLFLGERYIILSPTSQYALIVIFYD